VQTHEDYINRCIELAKNGTGSTYPNPLVGCVIVHDGKIIGEGWHKKYGESHAEVNAIQNVADKTLLSSSTLYVSLEPCSHYGKTPPCANLIIDRKIPTVVVGTTDPFAQVNGNGITLLRNAGINVIENINAEACRHLNRRFFTFHQKHRPYIILKWAESSDGFMAPLFKDSIAPHWITSPYSRQLVHKWRSEEQAILIGSQTAIDDNPSLTTRDWFGNNPIRLLIDRKARVPKGNNIFNNEAHTIVLSNDINDHTLAEDIVNMLYNENIQSVIIEGGRKTLQSFIDAKLWDESRIFIGKDPLQNGIPAPDFKERHGIKYTVGGDELIICTNHVQ
jgi:diaminohydroxyphosphoribosylaminopyrimidine deaminase/5-amino-6-(5-phosphoribosylamino)uracil reductase